MERRTVHKQDTHLLRLSLKNDLSSSHFDAIHLGTVVPFRLKSELSTFFSPHVVSDIASFGDRRALTFSQLHLY